MEEKEFRIQTLEAITVREETFQYNPSASIQAEQIISLFPHLGNKTQEESWMVCLDTRMNVIAKFMIGMGTINETPISPRDVFKNVLLINAFGFVLLHNHPSGDPTPSSADRAITTRMQECAILMGVKFYDHIILTGKKDAFFSFNRMGLISNW
jgi:DNA repair protein RadC